MGISSIDPVSWDCFDQNYNLPPFASDYSGGVCGYDPQKLVSIPYWYHCDGSNSESHYWMRTWDNSSNGMLERCYDNEGEGDLFRDCDGIQLVFNPEADLGRYLQIDLYSQCTNCTDGPWTGSWWSSKGNTPTLLLVSF